MLNWIVLSSMNGACLKSAIDLHLLDAECQNDALICKKQGASKLVLRKHQ